MSKVVISACTYKRPKGLRALLESLKTVKIPDDIVLSIRIIDNETTPAAQSLVEDLADGMPCPVHYVNETDPGIAPARNRALIEAQNDDFLVFVDDDETVHEDWLSELWNTQKQTQAHFVQGPVVMTVENQNDRWWLETILFKQKTFPDQAPRHEAWTNNVMIDMNFVRNQRLHFDPALCFDGGEDGLFFQQMTAKGAKGVFAANAIIYEVQPKDRLNWNWAIKRQFRNGNSRAMIARRMQPPPKAILHSLVRAGGCAVFSLLHMPSIIIKGQSGIANVLAYGARCVGVFWGMLGRRYLEYERQNSREEKTA